MKLGITREEIIKEVSFLVNEITKDMKKLDEALDHLESAHNINKAEMLKAINNPLFLKEINIYEVGLLGEQLSLSLNENRDWLNEYFNKNDIEEMRRYYQIRETITKKRTFKPAYKFSNNQYMVFMTRQEIAEAYDVGDFVWDETVQREGIYKTYSGRTEIVPKINNSNVDEIKKQAKGGKLITNALAYNIVPDSVKEDRIFYYDAENFELSIPDEFYGQILDGMHRTLGIHAAWLEQKNIVGDMPILLSSYYTPEAINWLVESAKAVPIDKTRLQALSNERDFDRVVNHLINTGKLVGKISTMTSSPSSARGEIVSYKVLSDAFYDLFEKHGGYKVLDVMLDFEEYIFYLFESFEEEFENGTTYLFENQYFLFHVHIFKCMFDNKIPYSKLRKIINIDDWNKENGTILEYKISPNSLGKSKIGRNGDKFLEEKIFNNAQSLMEG